MYKCISIYGSLSGRVIFEAPSSWNPTFAQHIPESASGLVMALQGVTFLVSSNSCWFSVVCKQHPLTINRALLHPEPYSESPVSLSKRIYPEPHSWMAVELKVYSCFHTLALVPSKPYTLKPYTPTTASASWTRRSGTLPSRLEAVDEGLLGLARGIYGV